MQIILASTSQYRRQLLQNIGLNIECVGSKVDEKPILGQNPTETSQLRAQAKAYSVIQAYFETTNDNEPVIVIGADQVVYIDKEIFGKPKSNDEWKRRLHKFSGRSHQLTTSVSLWEYGLSVEELQMLLSSENEVHLFDVRTAEERQIAKIEQAILLDQKGVELLSELPKTALIVFHCHHGMRSMSAAQRFLVEGYTNIYNLNGGIHAWSTNVDPSVPVY